MIESSKPSETNSFFCVSYVREYLSIGRDFPLKLALTYDGFILLSLKSSLKRVGLSSAPYLSLM